MLTLWEVKQNVNIPSEREKVPTAKHLREQEGVVACMRISREAEIRVYQCGYAVYRVGKYTTVFSVHLCGDYLYTMCGDIFCIEEAFFDCQEWYIRLVLEGEDRVSRNREQQENGKNISYSVVSEEWSRLADTEQSPLEQIIDKESVMEMMELLTERQKLIISKFYFCQKTQKEIAEEFGVAAPIISKAISNSIRKIRKNHLDIQKADAAGSMRTEERGKLHAR